MSSMMMIIMMTMTMKRLLASFVLLHELPGVLYVIVVVVAVSAAG